MPGFDGTGPQGRGAMSGRGMGYCADGEGQQPVYGRGRGFGCGRGRGGRGFARGFGPGQAGYGRAAVAAGPAGDDRIARLEAELAQLKQGLGRQD